MQLNMWNYYYDNGYNVYTNYPYNLIGTVPNINGRYYRTELKETPLGSRNLSPVPGTNVQKIPASSAGGIFGDDKVNENVALDSIHQKNEEYEPSTESSTKETTYCEPELRGSGCEFDDKSKYYDPLEQSNGYQDTQQREQSSNIYLNNPNDGEFDGTVQTACLFDNLKDDFSGPNESNQQSPNTGMYDSYNQGIVQQTLPDTPKGETVDGMFNQANSAYYWYPNGPNGEYTNQYNVMNVTGYDDALYNQNNVNFDQYNMTYDPYTANYITNVPNTVDLSSVFNPPYGSVLSPNEQFGNPAYKFQNKGFRNVNQMEGGYQIGSYPVTNQNFDAMYGYYNRRPGMKQTYIKDSIKNNQVKTIEDRMKIVPNSVSVDQKSSFKLIDEDTLEALIYSGNIKKIDSSNIDFINMSDRTWQALRGAGLFKLGNKGRAILKSKISKHLKMYPELRLE